jgi:hypothetical protein
MRNDRIDRPPLVLIGNPESKRVQCVRRAALAVGFDEPRILSYLDFVDGRDHADLVAPGSLVRLESPGESWEIERALLRAGVVPLEEACGNALRDEQLACMSSSRGEIHHPRQWFLGLRATLNAIESKLSAVPGVRWMSHPSQIVTMFDKQECQDRWKANGTPVPNAYPRLARYDEIRRTVDRRHARLFIKLRYGFSAMGAVALEWRGSRVRAITTVKVSHAMGRPRLFLSKRLHVLEREFEIAWLIDTLGVEGILVEEWMPKARFEGRSFDLRAVMIGGRASHVVGRASGSPFTNLNLDATRVPVESLERRLGDAWKNALSVCERAAAEFPDCTGIGIDLLVRPSRKDFAVLEANAFGDYLPNLLVDGRDTYTAELESLVSISPQGAAA